MAEQTEAEVVAELAQAAVDPFELERGKRYLIPDGTGSFSTDEDGDPRVLDTRGDLPVFKTGTVQVHDVASFAGYFGKHADADSELFTDKEAAAITAVLDAHRKTDAADTAARWQQHRLVLALKPTKAWTTWTRSNRTPMSQVDFAEFLEDNFGDLAPADEQPKDNEGRPVIDAAGLLELATKFQATVKASFSGGVRLQSGETQLSYSEEITPNGQGKKGTIEVPTQFALAIAPFDDCTTRLITARFRFRLGDRGVSFHYVLDNPERRWDEAVDEVMARAYQAIGSDRLMMRGKPAA